MAQYYIFMQSLRRIILSFFSAAHLLVQFPMQQSSNLPSASHTKMEVIPLHLRSTFREDAADNFRLYR